MSKTIEIKNQDHYAVLFVENIEKLINNLEICLPQEKMLLEVVKWTLTQQLTKEKVITEFIKHSKPFWNEIKAGNDNFFLDENKANMIFGKLPIDKVLNFKSYWTQFNNEQKEMVKAFFQKLVKHAEKYESFKNKLD
jgi:hypothetical protein